MVLPKFRAWSGKGHALANHGFRITSKPGSRCGRRPKYLAEAIHVPQTCNFHRRIRVSGQYQLRLLEGCPEAREMRWQAMELTCEARALTLHRPPPTARRSGRAIILPRLCGEGATLVHGGTCTAYRDLTGVSISMVVVLGPRSTTAGLGFASKDKDGGDFDRSTL